MAPNLSNPAFQPVPLAWKPEEKALILPEVPKRCRTVFPEMQFVAEAPTWNRVLSDLFCGGFLSTMCLVHARNATLSTSSLSPFSSVFWPHFRLRGPHATRGSWEQQATIGAPGCTTNGAIGRTPNATLARAQHRTRTSKAMKKGSELSHSKELRERRSYLAQPRSAHSALVMGGSESVEPGCDQVVPWRTTVGSCIGGFQWMFECLFQFCSSWVLQIETTAT